jgi:hypothetical protein
MGDNQSSRAAQLRAWHEGGAGISAGLDDEGNQVMSDQEKLLALAEGVILAMGEQKVKKSTLELANEIISSTRSRSAMDRVTEGD